MSKIKNYLFDFGQVLYRIRIDNTIQAFHSLSNDKQIFENTDHGLLLDNKCIDSYEKGKISTPKFRDCMRSSFSLNCSDQVFDNAWNSLLLGSNPKSIDVIRILNEKANISLLSNTSRLHFELFSIECQEMFSYFNHLFLSFEIGFRKPDRKAFEYVLQKTGYIPSETLFVDDCPKNIITANSLGFQTYHLQEMKILSDLLHTV